MSVVMRTQLSDPMKLAGPLREELTAIDKNQPIHSLRQCKRLFLIW
jgi:hypothetical protein